MGTRRSRHNKGRKPFYKHFERDTVRIGIKEEKPARERVIPPPDKRGNYTEPKTAKVVELEAAVVRFMAARAKKAQDAANELRELTAGLPSTPERIVLGGREVIEVSRTDLLLQLFQERKISGPQLRAGRAWQFTLHRATLQPMATIAWNPDAGKRYQVRGTLSESQWEAMRRRKIFREEAGSRCVEFADFCLGREWQRASLMKALGVNGQQFGAMLDALLSELALHFGSHHVEPKRLAA